MKTTALTLGLQRRLQELRRAVCRFIVVAGAVSVSGMVTTTGSAAGAKDTAAEVSHAPGMADLRGIGGLIDAIDQARTEADIIPLRDDLVMMVTARRVDSGTASPAAALLRSVDQLIHLARVEQDRVEQVGALVSKAMFAHNVALSILDQHPYAGSAWIPTDTHLNRWSGYGVNPTRDVSLHGATARAGDIARHWDAVGAASPPQWHVPAAAHTKTIDQILAPNEPSRTWLLTVALKDLAVHTRLAAASRDPWTVALALDTARAAYDRARSLSFFERMDSPVRLTLDIHRELQASVSDLWSDRVGDAAQRLRAVSDARAAASALDAAQYQTTNPQPEPATPVVRLANAELSTATETLSLVGATMFGGLVFAFVMSHHKGRAPQPVKAMTRHRTGPARRRPTVVNSPSRVRRFRRDTGLSTEQK